MKVLYISNPLFFDLDLSLIKHLSKYCEVHYLMDLPITYLNKSALNLYNSKTEPGILNAKEFNELEQFKKYIPLIKFSVINRVSSNMFSYSNLKLQIEINQFIDKLNPNVIHCANFLNRNFLFFLIRNKRKIAVTIHDPFPHSGEERFTNKIIRKFNYLFIKNIILLNYNQKYSFLNSTKFFKFKNILVSSLGIYEYLRNYPVTISNPDTFKILFFGRIQIYKGIDDLLSAFSNVENLYPDIELTIAGSGKFWFDISDYEKNPRIRIINRYIPNAELANLIANTDIVVCPYKDATQSGVIMSSFAMNKPVLCTRVGGLTEMIEDGKTGFLVKPNNIQALSNKLKEIIENRNCLKEIENNIKNENINGVKSWPQITHHLFQFYSDI